MTTAARVGATAGGGGGGSGAPLPSGTGARGVGFLLSLVSDCGIRDIFATRMRYFLLSRTITWSKNRDRSTRQCRALRKHLSVVIIPPFPPLLMLLVFWRINARLFFFIISCFFFAMTKLASSFSSRVPTSPMIAPKPDRSDVIVPPPVSGGAFGCEGDEEERNESMDVDDASFDGSDLPLAGCFVGVPAGAPSVETLEL
mmetsp:Transcript_2817/g.6573  ORF Transcript_2817/g.6573 Transcript_2817/m.6573 type:complete len:200 (+) Transcript_2817:1510-2109(+)